MAKFELYQKGPEDFYGTIMSSTTLRYKKGAGYYNGGYQNYSYNFEYPLDYPTIISGIIISDSEALSETYSIEIRCNIPKCVDVSVKGMDFDGNELPNLNTQYWNITPVDGTDSEFTINIYNIFNDAFKNSNASFETIYAACLVYEFKEGTSFINMSTNSYNETIAEVSDKFNDVSKISYAFMTKPSDVQSQVRIPMYFNGDPANVFSNTTPLTIQTNYPSQTSTYFKGYYIGRSSTNTSENDHELSKDGTGTVYQTNIKEINNYILTDEDRASLISGENVNLCLWMHYSAPRQITPFNQRKIRIIKAY